MLCLFKGKKEAFDNQSCQSGCFSYFLLFKVTFTFSLQVSYKRRVVVIFSRMKEKKGSRSHSSEILSLNRSH